MIIDEIRPQLCRLIPRFGVGRQATDVLTAFDTLCGESLAIDAGERSPERSRINADGTPFQFSLDLSRTGLPGLQFLGEAGRVMGSAGMRRHASEAALRDLARLCGVDARLEQAAALLQVLVPPLDASRTTPSSLYWFALRFTPERAPALTVYVNGAWGSEDDRRQRCGALAARAGSAARWSAVSAACGPLSPLGAAITLRRDAAPRPRLYWRGYGLPMRVYRDAMTCVAPARDVDDALAPCARVLLGEAAGRPTQSAVFSLDLADDAAAGAKLEFCAHCAFDDDAAAEGRIVAWLQHAGFDDAMYRTLVGELTRGGAPLAPAPGRRPSLHAFVGVGVRAGQPYASLYLNPGAGLGAG